LSRGLPISRIINFHRKKAGLSREALARLSGVGKSTIFDLEKGKETIRFSSLLKICTVLNIHIDFRGPLMEVLENEES